MSILRLLDPARSMESVPLERADRVCLFATNASDLRAREQQEMRASSLLHDASKVAESYPQIFERNGRILRYAYLPASGPASGLVVLFHGHNAFLHLGPLRAWRHFHILAPWDTFGWRRQGSWFWGEKGTSFVEPLIQELIAEHRERLPGLPWFCTGGSMGGFAALYHGIKGGCAGVYVTCPQVDLRAKVIEYGLGNPNNPYGYLKGDTIETVPDLLGVANEIEHLPPLFLIQHQYDPVNPFAAHGFRLCETYNRKQAWYALRIYPSIGHGSDGSQQEAELFFKLIIEKDPPRSFLAAAGGLAIAK